MPVTIPPATHAGTRSPSRSRAGFVRRLLDRVAQKFFQLRCAKLVYRDIPPATAIAVQDTPLVLPEGFTFRTLSAQDIEEFAENPDHDLDSSLSALLDDEHTVCFAVLEGGRLASYCWYTVAPVAAEHHWGVALHLPPHTAYAFKAFTCPVYRGRGLHQSAMELAFEELSRRFGTRRVLASIAWTNDASRRCYRAAGFHELGSLITTGSRPVVRHVPALAARIGVRFGADPETCAARSEPRCRARAAR